MKKRMGWTLVEILVVLAILGLIVALTVPIVAAFATKIKRDNEAAAAELFNQDYIRAVAVDGNRIVIILGMDGRRDSLWTKQIGENETSWENIPLVNPEE